MMSMNELTTFFGWGAVINIALITLSALMVLGMRSFVLKVHSSMFNVPEASRFASLTSSRSFFQLKMLALLTLNSAATSSARHLSMR